MAEHLTEEQQVEAIKNWWKENGMSVVLGLVIGFGALFGWNYYQDYRDERAAEASLVYQGMMNSLRSNKNDDVEAGSKELIENYASTPYATLAAFTLAKLAVESNDLAMARQWLQWVLDNSNQEQFEHTARVRLARVMISGGELDAAESLISQVKAGAYAAAYAELRGDIALARGDRTGALTAYKDALNAIVDDDAQRQQIQQKLDDVAIAVGAG